MAKKSDDFNKDVYVLDKLPKQGLLIEMSNIVKKVGAVSRYTWIDVVVTDLKTKSVLVKKPFGSNSNFQGFNHISRKYINTFHKYLNVYGDEEIDIRRLPEWKDGKCINNCNQIAKKYRL